MWTSPWAEAERARCTRPATVEMMLFCGCYSNTEPMFSRRTVKETQRYTSLSTGLLNTGKLVKKPGQYADYELPALSVIYVSCRGVYLCCSFSLWWPGCASEEELSRSSECSQQRWSHTGRPSELDETNRGNNRHNNVMGRFCIVRLKVWSIKGWISQRTVIKISQISKRQVFLFVQPAVKNPKSLNQYHFYYYYY